MYLNVRRFVFRKRRTRSGDEVRLGLLLLLLFGLGWSWSSHNLFRVCLISLTILFLMSRQSALKTGLKLVFVPCCYFNFPFHRTERLWDVFLQLNLHGSVSCLGTGALPHYVVRPQTISPKLRKIAYTVVLFTSMGKPLTLTQVPPGKCWVTSIFWPLIRSPAISRPVATSWLVRCNSHTPLPLGMTASIFLATGPKAAHTSSPVTGG